MRKLTDHIVAGDAANHQLVITVRDEPGSGGANHRYLVQAANTDVDVDVDFQNGPIGQVGVNGLTHEALLAIIIDRLRSFQAGPFACGDNAIALSHCEEALRQLQKRTLASIARGIEGTHAK